MLKRILCLLTVCMLASTFVFSQVTTSSLTGTVKDASGENLAGASITATHTPSGTKYSTVSQQNGQFTILNMRVGGPYLVEITFVGNETLKFDDIYLKLGEGFVLDANMRKSDATMENVVITTQNRNTILNANRTGAVTNITSRELQRLPSITRSINDFTRLTPQANGTSIGGGNYRQNYITVDGSDFNNTFGIGSNLPAGGSPISLDALDEVSVNVTPYDIRQSGFIGSAVNAVTRSGTNRFQGSVYRYWRSEKQQGDEVSGVKFTRPPFEFEQYGARLGGPIIPNKLFFFINYETENQPKVVQSRFASRPGAAFGSAPNIARPTAADLDMISNYLRTNYGYETGPYDNYSTEIERTKLLARIDWNISDKHRFNIRYNQVEGGEPNPPSTSTGGTGFTVPSGQTRNDINSMWFKNSNYFQGANFYSLAAELNSVLSNNLANTFRGTYTNQDDSRESDSQDFPFVDIMKDGQNYTSFGYELFSKGNLRKVKTYSFVNNLTYTKGIHTATVGAQFDHSTTVNGFQRFATSYYRFNSWDDFVNGENPNDFALTYSLLPGFAQAFPSFKFAQFSLYAQDEMALTDRFRLTAGLRVDMPTYPDVTEIREHPLVSGLTFADGQKLNTGNLPKTTPLWSPRLGFNWDINGDRSFQVRGGSGIFTGRVPFVWIVSQSGDAGLLQVTQSWNGLSNTPGPFNPNPRAYLPATVPTPGSVVPSAITALSEDFKFPQTWKTSLGMDKRLPGNMVLTIEAIYNKDLNTAMFRNANLVEGENLNIAGYPDNRPMYPSAVRDRFLNPLTSATYNATTNPNPSTPVPNGDARGTQAFNAIVMDNGTKGYYFSFTTKLEKQFSRGWFASIAYTKSIAENLFDGGGDQPLSAWQGTPTYRSPNNPGLGTAGFVVPDRIVGAISYRKEYLKHLGTTISIFYEGSSQGRYSYTYSTDFNRDGVTGNDLIYIPRDPSEITFVDRPASAATGGVAYTAAQQSALFFQYIDQDKYLRDRKGKYAERNGARLPWRNQFDLKVIQDVFMNIGKNRNSLQFTLDIFNFGNLIDSDWGKLKTVNAPALLVPQSVSTTARPTFWLQTDRNHPVTESFRDNVSIFSTYYMQFGLRYNFN